MNYNPNNVVDDDAEDDDDDQDNWLFKLTILF